ncbi:MAG: DNA polymerase III subunit alpha, partial [Alphaproteobacteria bacterium]|nr:DNA polymerase III subunit alpha [Alphaproteobacteria bacterium]
APPCINASVAEFGVEQTDDGYAVRYALAGIRNVGGKAMDAICAEREASGPFESLSDLFGRLPKGSMNSRQLEALACAGALDSLEPNRAKVFANADLLLAVADAAERERSSGQAALFGGEDTQQGETLRLKEVEPWPRATMMAHERDNFGFYFSDHPVQAWRQVASANGARSYASLMTGGAPAGGRAPAVMAAMIEKVNKGTTRRGKPFVRADFSDASGQFSAACFEESLVENFLRWAEDQTCLLLQVELDSPSPDEPPRITVRGGVPLEQVSSSARMMLSLDVTEEAAIAALQLELGESGGTGEVIATLRTGLAIEPTLKLGSGFKLDGELAERLASVPGLANVHLTTRRGGGHLRLVA